MHKALGRGLESLIPAAKTQVPAGPSSETVVNLPTGKIKPNKYQPRTTFNEEKLKELAESIKQHGLAQPLLVTASVIPGEYELIAGERRWRAAQIAGMKEVTAIIKHVDDRERFHLAMIENIQRENLNPIEEATAYKRLMDEFKHTQEGLAKIMGKDRSVIANSLRLLSLPAEIQDIIAQGGITAGHGKILAGIDDKNKVKTLADRIVKEKLTVRETEKIVADWKTVLSDGKTAKAQRRDAELSQLAEEFQRLLGTKVEIVGKANKGKIEIQYFSLEELERIANRIRGSKGNGEQK